MIPRSRTSRRVGEWLEYVRTYYSITNNIVVCMYSTVRDTHEIRQIANRQNGITTHSNNQKEVNNVESS